MRLRPYQQEVYDLIYDAWTRVRSVLAIVPTGGGKTVIFSKKVHDHTGASCSVVHRKEIISQISLSLASLGIRHRVIAPSNVVRRIRRRQYKKFGKSFIDDNAPASVASVQTLASKTSLNDARLQKYLDSVSLCVFDEGHHYVKTGTWGKAVDRFKAERMLFVTASPARADGKGLGSTFDGFVDEMVIGPTTRWLIDNGWLSPFKYYAPSSDLDVQGIAVGKNGDFNAKALRARVVDSHLVGDVVDQYFKYARGKKAIVFATDVQTAEEIAERFRGAGVRAKALSGDTDPTERDNALDDFEGDGLDLLVNVDLFDEGFDVPAVDCVIMARPTESLAKFLQMVGRALRVIYAQGFDLETTEGRLASIAAGPKPNAIILDPVRNWERHGMPDWPRKWTLANTKDSGDGSVTPMIKQRICLECTQPYEAFHLACPYCGAVPQTPDRGSIEKVDGDLSELNVEAMQALFAQHAAANMAPEDYALDQVARNTHPLGRVADMKRHCAALNERKRLEHFVGWWVGCQPGRDLKEIHKRFYLRFGVDIMTAFTLNADQTRQLFDTIKERFSDDL